LIDLSISEKLGQQADPIIYCNVQIQRLIIQFIIALLMLLFQRKRTQFYVYDQINNKALGITERCFEIYLYILNKILDNSNNVENSIGKMIFEL
jgi:cell shape-determining protein MreC